MQASGSNLHKTSALPVQIGAKIVKAGPDNGTVYMTGMAVIYKEHQILVEVNNDGSGILCECTSSSWLFTCSSCNRCRYQRDLSSNKAS
jgi:hypothetical protein